MGIDSWPRLVDGRGQQFTVQNMLGDELNLFRSGLDGPLAFLILLPVPPVLGGDIGWEDELENQLSGYHSAGHHDPRSLMAWGPGVVECDWPGRLLFRSWSNITMSRLGLDWYSTSVKTKRHETQEWIFTKLCKLWHIRMYPGIRVRSVFSLNMKSKCEILY